MNENLDNVLHLWFTGAYFKQALNHLLTYGTSIPPEEPEDTLSAIISFNRSIINNNKVAQFGNDVVTFLTQFSLVDYLLFILFLIILYLSLYINYCMGGNSSRSIRTTEINVDKLLTEAITVVESETIISPDPGIDDIDILHPDMNDADSDKDE